MTVLDVVLDVRGSLSFMFAILLANVCFCFWVACICVRNGCELSC